MASPAVIGFHNSQMAQERQRVALRIANGTKASSNLIIGARMQHPTYKGLIDNSTGSKTRPFFAMKDESDVRLEDKVRMRGGVLSTDAGMQFAKAILKRRAVDMKNQRLAADGLPIQPSPLIELDESESKSLELNNILDAIADAAQAGATYGLPLSEVSKIPRLFIALSPTFSEQQITDLINTIDGIINLLEDNVARPLRAPRRFADAEDAANSVSSDRLIGPLGRSRRFLKGLLPIVNMANDLDRRIAIKILAKREFAKIVSKDAVDRLLSERAEAAEEAGAEDERFAPEALLQIPPLIAADEAEGEAEGEEAAAAAAPIRRRRQVPRPVEEVSKIARVGIIDLTAQDNYDQFSEYLDKFTTKAAMAAAKRRLVYNINQRGLDAEEAMQDMIDNDWSPRG
jgi:hypothetical protein